MTLEGKTDNNTMRQRLDESLVHSRQSLEAKILQTERTFKQP